ncbi:hypothetical protein JQ574_17510 [Bradyrhizobium sp. AUGA SZCCT0158]|uniref:hypothetical protein n=1 Tax=Bradyrhizobium sp. AUGA SZCCT0158 TaxID=2807661 RepID=UPI001BADF589|nr:hypothetical protein [Bradyrhizobium sp. AUGA SZCCT0158]MBR1197796.1 hypothetical protein [Bradyrhizobium sp. AUGA SZCCT0158]
MVRRQGPVLVDTNVILECWRVNAWNALSGGYGVETVEDCVIETQTGYQRRREEQRVEQAVLAASLRAVHKVGKAELAGVLLRDPLAANLDHGERSLWAHAVGRADAWVLCGPDKASLRFGVRLGLRDRLVALERLLSDAGHKAGSVLRENYTSKWLDRILGEMVMSEGAKRK